MMHANTVQFATMNALRTGNVLVDTLMGFTIPAVIALLYQAVSWCSQTLPMWIKNRRAGSFYYRVISHNHTDKSCEALASGAVRNQILQKAMLMYLGDNKIWSNMLGNIEFRALQEANGYDSFGYRTYGSSSSQMKAYKTYTTPPDNVWIDVGEGVQLKICKVTIGTSDVKTEKITEMHLRHYSSSCNIDNFLGSVRDWYIKHIASTEDHTRYMYSPFTTFDTTNKSHVMSYKRHALSDSKCFDSMFFPRKAHIVKMVDDFMYKRGKYSKRGFPHKLGILLHGPPGSGKAQKNFVVKLHDGSIVRETYSFGDSLYSMCHCCVHFASAGKTSFIKSLAEHTGRNIVNVRLSQVSTNDQLMNIMYDQTFAVAAGSVRLAFASTIFVLEDIDAASDVVTSRSEEANATNTSHLRESGPADKDVQHYLYKEADALNLAGVLNVLDGVVDSPGRIIVMTSNYPEKLDAALIRPGRIDHKILMDYMTGEDACSLAQHYFGVKLTEEQTHALTKAVDGCIIIDSKDMEVQSIDSCEAVSVRFTPAQLEQWCAEYDNVDDYVQAVVAKAQLY